MHEWLRLKALRPIAAALCFGCGKVKGIAITEAYDSLQARQGRSGIRGLRADVTVNVDKSARYTGEVDTANAMP